MTRQGTAVVESVVAGGHGMFRLDKAVCFVPGAIPGDTIAYRVDKEQKNVSWATILEIVEPSPHRTAVDVPLHGGNGWLPFAYPAQGEWKKKIVAACFPRLADIPVDVEFLEVPALRHGYRTRATFHSDGKRVGFYERASHEIVAAAACPLLHPNLRKTIDPLERARFKGDVEITVNPEGDDVLAWSRTFNERLAGAFHAYNALKPPNTRRHFMFDGAPIVNGAFSQGSLLLNRMLVECVRTVMSECGSVLDLYCGNGNLTIGLPADVTVQGIDHNYAAVEAADAIRPGSYTQGGEKAFERALNASWDVVVLDPPRQGAKGIATSLASAKTNRIVYVSCDPASLARDVKTLAKAGWRVEAVTAVDMFPHTPHIEAAFSPRRPRGTRRKYAEEQRWRAPIGITSNGRAI